MALNLLRFPFHWLEFLLYRGSIGREWVEGMSAFARSSMCGAVELLSFFLGCGFGNGWLDISRGNDGEAPRTHVFEVICIRGSFTTPYMLVHFFLLPFDRRGFHFSFACSILSSTKTHRSFVDLRVIATPCYSYDPPPPGRILPSHQNPIGSSSATPSWRDATTHVDSKTVCVCLCL